MTTVDKKTNGWNVTKLGWDQDHPKALQLVSTHQVLALLDSSVKVRNEMPGVKKRIGRMFEKHKSTSKTVLSFVKDKRQRPCVKMRQGSCTYLRKTVWLNNYELKQFLNEDFNTGVKCVRQRKKIFEWTSKNSEELFSRHDSGGFKTSRRNNYKVGFIVMK